MTGIKKKFLTSTQNNEIHFIILSFFDMEYCEGCEEKRKDRDFDTIPLKQTKIA